MLWKFSKLSSLWSVATPWLLITHLNLNFIFQKFLLKSLQSLGLITANYKEGKGWMFEQVLLRLCDLVAPWVLILRTSMSDKREFIWLQIRNLKTFLFFSIVLQLNAWKHLRFPFILVWHNPCNCWLFLNNWPERCDGRTAKFKLYAVIFFLTGIVLVGIYWRTFLISSPPKYSLYIGRNILVDISHLQSP